MENSSTCSLLVALKDKGERERGGGGKEDINWHTCICNKFRANFEFTKNTYNVP